MYGTSKVVAVIALGVVLAGALGAPGEAAETAKQPAKEVATLSVGTTSVDWSPAVDYVRLVLTVVGPEGFENRQELEAGQIPSLSLFKSNGERLPDGIYRYELRLLPQTVVSAGNLMDKSVQRGTLWIRDGAFVTPTPDKNPMTAGASSKPPQIQNITGKDSVIPDDLVVQGTACIGPNCLNGDPDANTLTLKGGTPHIFFHDPTADCHCYPARNWVLQANENWPSLPADHFFLRDVLSGTIPFSVEGGAPNYTLVVSKGGFDGQEPRVGIGTQVPLKNLHVLNAATPTIRLEQPVSPGPARVWDVGADHTQFFVSDVTNSSSQPFRIRAGAPTSSIDVASSGNVGIGTTNPGARLEVSGGEVRLPPGAGAAGFTHFNYVGDGKNYIRGTTIIADNAGSVGIGTASPSSKLTIKSAGGNADVVQVVKSSDSQVIMRLFQTTNGDGLMSLFSTAGAEQGRLTGSGGGNWLSGTVGINCNSSGGFDFAIKTGTSSTTACNSGTYSGISAGQTTFTVPSSRTMKTDIQPVQVPDILDKIKAVDVYTYNYIDGPKDRLGLMAEDFHQIFGRGSDKLLNGQEVEMALWLAVQELTKHNEALLQSNEALTQRVAEIEAQMKKQQQP